MTSHLIAGLWIFCDCRIGYQSVILVRTINARLPGEFIAMYLLFIFGEPIPIDRQRKGLYSELLSQCCLYLGDSPQTAIKTRNRDNVPSWGVLVDIRFNADSIFQDKNILFGFSSRYTSYGMMTVSLSGSGFKLSRIIFVILYVAFT